MPFHGVPFSFSLLFLLKIKKEKENAQDIISK
jgi:hypothetical protein